VDLSWMMQKERARSAGIFGLLLAEKKPMD